MEEKYDYVCRKPQCDYNLTQRKFTARGLVNHYGSKHASIEEGRRQLKLQGKRLETKPTHMVTVDHVPMIDETGQAIQEPPAPTEEPKRADASAIDVKGFLSNHIENLKAQIQNASDRFQAVKAELDQLQGELFRANAAQQAYASTETKSRTAGSANDGEYA